MEIYKLTEIYKLNVKCYWKITYLILNTKNFFCFAEWYLLGPGMNGDWGLYFKF